MAAMIENGIEIEIIVRQRKGHSPVGKAGHGYMVRTGAQYTLKERTALVETIKNAVASAVPGLEDPRP